MDDRGKASEGGGGGGSGERERESEREREREWGRERGGPSNVEKQPPAGRRRGERSGEWPEEGGEKCSLLLLSLLRMAGGGRGGARKMIWVAQGQIASGAIGRLGEKTMDRGATGTGKRRLGGREMETERKIDR